MIPLSRSTVEELAKEDVCEESDHVEQSLGRYGDTVEDEVVDVKIRSLGKISTQKRDSHGRLLDNLCSDAGGTRRERSNEEDNDHLEPEIPFLGIQFDFRQSDGTGQFRDD